MLNTLEHDSSLAIEWFDNNYMKLNKSKCHFVVSGHKFEHLWVNVGDTRVWESNSKKLLGVQIESDLSFDKHVIEICKRASRKLSALTRLAAILPFHRARALMKSFFESQFSYCPLIWMFINRGTNHKINRLHERSLRILYKDDISTFEELLLKDNSVTVHTRNIQLLATEMYKVRNNISPDYIREIFPISNSAYNTRVPNTFKRPSVKTVAWGTETLRNLGPKIWDLLPSDMKKLPTLDLFNIKIKQWKTDKCPCRLCKIYIPDIGFI